MANYWWNSSEVALIIAKALIIVSLLGFAVIGFVLFMSSPIENPTPNQRNSTHIIIAEGLLK